MEKYIKTTQIVGKGNFGKVSLVQRKYDKKLCAMKTISLSSEKDKVNAQNEAQLLEKLDHPNIVKCYDTFFEGDDQLCLIMEYCENGDLQQKIKEIKGNNEYISEAQILEWFVQLCLAIKYLHEENILHRDIKVQNVFLTNSGIVKLGDFGISKQLDRTDDLGNTQTGTPFYLTPEMCSHSTSTKKSDIWHLGCLLHELCSLEKPFHGENLRVVIKKITEEKYSTIPVRYSQFIHQLIDSLLDKDPEKRPTIQMILNLPIIQEETTKVLKKYQDAYSKSSIRDFKPKLQEITPTMSFESFRWSKRAEETSSQEEKKVEIQTFDEPNTLKPTKSDEPRLSMNLLISPKVNLPNSQVMLQENSKPPLPDQNSHKKKSNNSIRSVIEQKKANLSPSSQFDKPHHNISTPLGLKQPGGMNDYFKQINNQSPIIRPVRVSHDEGESIITEHIRKDNIKKIEIGASKPAEYKKHLSINIPGPNSEQTEQPSSKEDPNKNKKSPIDGMDPNTLPTQKAQKKFAFSDQVFDHRSPASPNRSFWVSEFLNKRLGEEKYKRVKDLLESSHNPMQILKEKPNSLLEIIGEENHDCLVMLGFLISHSSNSVTPTGEHKIFKNFDKNFKSPLSSQRVPKHTFPIGDFSDDFSHKSMSNRMTPKESKTKAGPDS